VTTYAERRTKIGLVVADEWTTIVKLKPTNVGSLPFFFTKVAAMAMFLEIPGIGKRGPDRSSALKRLSFSEKIAKIGPVET